MLFAWKWDRCSALCLRGLWQCSILCGYLDWMVVATQISPSTIPATDSGELLQHPFSALMEASIQILAAPEARSKVQAAKDQVQGAI